MAQSLNPRRQRLKLLALIAIFAAPMVVAWGMVEWRVGIPEERTAHGELDPDIPALAQWPLTESASLDDDDWLLAYDCSDDCERLADQWWRLHRALGREAPRVSRLRVGGEGEPLPGESAVQWASVPQWQTPGRLWVLDPQGRAVLGYSAQVDPNDVLDDVERLLSMNSEP